MWQLPPVKRCVFLLHALVIGPLVLFASLNVALVSSYGVFCLVNSLQSDFLRNDVDMKKLTTVSTASASGVLRTSITKTTKV